MIGPGADPVRLCLGWVLSPFDITVKGRMGCVGWLFLGGLHNVECARTAISRVSDGKHDIRADRIVH